MFYLNLFINFGYIVNSVSFFNKNSRSSYNNIFMTEIDNKTILFQKDIFEIIQKNSNIIKQIPDYYDINENFLVDSTKIINSNLEKYTTSLYFKSLNNNFKIKNELKFLLKRRRKVYIHIQQLFSNTNIFHIGISFYNINNNIRYDLRGYNIENINFLNKNLYDETLFWGYTNTTLKQILDYESSLKYKYILGIYDCRHYVRNLSEWSMNKPTPIWKLDKLLKKN